MVTDSPGWEAREGSSGTVYDGKMWMMAGCGSSNYFNDVWYSADGVSWTCAATSAAWSYRVCPAVTTFDGRMWLMGGGAYLSAGFTAYNDVWYSTDGADWTCATSSAPWGARMGHELVVYDNKMWVIGGGLLQSSTKYNDIWSSSDGVNWTCVESSAPWSARLDHSCSVYDGRIWLMGGEGSGNPLNDVWSMSLTGIAREESLIQTEEVSVFPNPSAGLVEVSFTLPAEKEVRVDIFDTAGRNVCCISDEVMCSGSHTVVWNGRDSSGSESGAGVYFVRIQAEDSSICRMVTRW
jgi:hypothetical protein